MTILIFDDITALTHWVELATRTDEPGRGSVVSIAQSIEHLQECADRMAAETLAVVQEMRALMNEQTPMFGFHRPGLITPRRVDNADRSGANQFKRVNATYGPGITIQAPRHQTPRRGAFFCPFHFWPLSYHLTPRSLHKLAHSCHFLAQNCTFGNVAFSPYVCLTSKKHGPTLWQKSRFPPSVK